MRARARGSSSSQVYTSRSVSYCYQSSTPYVKDFRKASSRKKKIMKKCVLRCHECKRTFSGIKQDDVFDSPSKYYFVSHPTRPERLHFCSKDCMDETRRKSYILISDKDSPQLELVSRKTLEDTPDRFYFCCDRPMCIPRTSLGTENEKDLDKAFQEFKNHFVNTALPSFVSFPSMKYSFFPCSDPPTVDLIANK